jgi:hypothetical protein
MPSLSGNGQWPASRPRPHAMFACAACLGDAQPARRSPLQVTSIMMVNANTIFNIINGTNGYSKVSGDLKDRINCYFAGLIMTMILNILWVS